MAKFFEESLAELQTNNEGVVGRFRRLTAGHFTATIYLNGKSAIACGIRLGGILNSKQIVFSRDPNSTNSMNEAAGVQDDGQTMFLKAVGLSAMMGGQGKVKDRLAPQDAAEMFWNLLLAPLRR